MKETVKSRLINSWIVRIWSNTNPIKKAILVGIITIVVYLSVVIVTTPALEPLAAISAAFQINSIVMIGMGVGIGLQVFLSEKSKLLGCKLNVKKKAFGGNSGSVATTSFFSFFSLVPLGCCGIAIADDHTEYWYSATYNGKKITESEFHLDLPQKPCGSMSQTCICKVTKQEREQFKFRP